MMHPASLVSKTQATLGLKWTTKKVWDKLSQIKRSIRESYFKVLGKQKKDVKPEEIVIQEQCSTILAKSSIVRFPLQMYKATLKGYASRVRKQALEGWVLYMRKPQHFRQDYLWRRMCAGHLIGFSTLFLFHEEHEMEEVNFKKRSQECDRLCENIKMTLFKESMLNREENIIPSCTGFKLNDFKLGKCITAGCNGVVYEAQLKGDNPADGRKKEQVHSEDCSVKNTGRHSKKKTGCNSSDLMKMGHQQLAIKMLYNFDSSNANAIHRLTKAELITCKKFALSHLTKDGQFGRDVHIKRLSPHPNILRIQRALIDKIPEELGLATNFPALLPRPAGLSCSTTMFLIMKRYDCTLEDYLKERELTATIKHLVVLQLLQGVAHLEKNKVAHRDLKSNNLLIEHDSENGEELIFPFPTSNYDIRNGNAEFQPPEIKHCYAGLSSYLDYRKSDAWACGLLLCDIMGFTFSSEDGDWRSSCNREHSTSMTESLVKLLLECDRKKRITCQLAANILYLEMFGPKLQQKLHDGRKWVNTVASASLSNWLLMHTSETLTYKLMTAWGHDSVLCDIFTNFLSEVSVVKLSAAVDWFFCLSQQ